MSVLMGESHQDVHVTMLTITFIALRNLPYPKLCSCYKIINRIRMFLEVNTSACRVYDTAI